MVTGKEVVAGRASVELVANITEMERGLRTARWKLNEFATHVNNMGRQMAMWGGAIVTPMLTATRSFARFGYDLEIASRRLGTSVETISALSYVTSMLGMDMDAVVTSARRLQKAVGSAMTDITNNGNKARKMFALLGLEASKLAGMDLAEMLFLIADRLQRIDSQELKVEILQNLFGRYGFQWIPLLEDGGEVIREFIERANELNVILSGEMAKTGFELNMNLKNLWFTLKMVSYAVGNALAPAINTFISKQLLPLIGGLIQWIRDNGAIVVGTLKFGLALLTAGLAARIIYRVLKSIAAMLSLLLIVTWSWKVAIKAVAAAFVALRGLVIGFLLLTRGVRYALVGIWTTIKAIRTVIISTSMAIQAIRTGYLMVSAALLSTIAIVVVWRNLMRGIVALVTSIGASLLHIGSAVIVFGALYLVFQQLWQFFQLFVAGAKNAVSAIKSLKEEFKGLFDFIVRAMKEGRFVLALQALGIGLKMTLMTALAELEKVMIDWMNTTATGKFLAKQLGLSVRIAPIPAIYMSPATAPFDPSDVTILRDREPERWEVPPPSGWYGKEMEDFKTAMAGLETSLATGGLTELEKTITGLWDVAAKVLGLDYDVDDVAGGLKSGAMGWFSPFAISGFGAQLVFERIQKNTHEAAGNTKKSAESLKNIDDGLKTGFLNFS